MPSPPAPLTLAKVAWRLLPMGVRARAGASLRAALAPMRAAALPRAAPQARRASDTVTLVGLGASSLGVGHAARLLVEELRAGGVDVRIKDVTAMVAAPQDSALEPSQPDGDWPLIIALNPDVAVHVLADLPRGLLEGRRVIGFWVWELSKLPRTWDIARGWVHEIWTPSAFSAEAMAALGVPVFRTPHAVALAPAPVLPPAEEARASLGLSASDFIAVNSFSLSSSLTRKHPFAAMDAFTAAFPDGGAKLVLRVLESDRYPDAWRALCAHAARCGPSVWLMDTPGPLSTLHQLYAAADLYLSLHRSEGFGLNLAEAMLAGVPVMATDYSAPLEFLDADCAVLIGARAVPAVDRFGPYTVPGATWAEPDIDQAIAALRRLKGDRTLRADLAERARRRALTMKGGAAVRALRLQAAP